MTTFITTSADKVFEGAETAASTAASAADIITDTAAVGDGGGFINFEGFLETLPMMGKGMLGIFAVTIVIILMIKLLGLIKGRDK